MCQKFIFIMLKLALRAVCDIQADEITVVHHQLRAFGCRHPTTLPTSRYSGTVDYWSDYTIKLIYF